MSLVGLQFPHELDSARQIESAGRQPQRRRDLTEAQSFLATSRIVERKNPAQGRATLPM